MSDEIKQLQDRLRKLEDDLVAERATRAANQPKPRGFVAALFGLIGGSAAAAVIGFFSSSSVEKQKFSYSVIQTALASDSADERVQRLQFLLDLGVITDDDIRQRVKAKLKTATTKPESLPQLPPPVAEPAAPSASAQRPVIFVGSGWAYFGTFQNNTWQTPSVAGLTGLPEVGKFYRTTSLLNIRDDRPIGQLGRVTNGVLKGVWLGVEQVWKNDKTDSVWCRVKIVTDRYKEDSPPETLSERQ